MEKWQSDTSHKGGGVGSLAKWWICMNMFNENYEPFLIWSHNLYNIQDSS